METTTQEPEMVISETLVEQARTYLKALDAERRAEEAEGRAFGSWFHDRTVNKQGTARKAKSRANAANMRRIHAETSALWNAMDEQPWDGTAAGDAARQADMERFCRAITKEAVS